MTQQKHRVIARFVGKHGSMGLVRGRIYRLEVTYTTASSFEKFLNWMVGTQIFPVSIQVVYKAGKKEVMGIWKCPYSSQEAFHANWRIDESNNFFMNANR